jgi:hypothetical protein
MGDQHLDWRHGHGMLPEAMSNEYNFSLLIQVSNEYNYSLLIPVSKEQ